MKQIAVLELLCFLLSSVFQRSLVCSSPYLYVFVVGSGLSDCFQHVCGRGVIAKSLTHVDEQVFVPRRKYKAASEL
jgi:hypothetical protein